jgi:hypothetical protein
MPLIYPLGDAALTAFEKVRLLTRKAGRGASKLGIEVKVSLGIGTEDDWRQETGSGKLLGHARDRTHHIYRKRSLTGTLHGRVRWGDPALFNRGRGMVCQVICQLMGTASVAWKS